MSISTEEKVLYTGKVHRSSYIIPVILTFFTYGLLFLLIIYQRNKKIELTNKKFTYSYGIFSKNELSIKTEKIESVRIKKGIFNMIFGGGTIIVSGTGGNFEPIKNADEPEKIKNFIENLIH